FAAGLRDALHGGFALFGIAPGEHHDSAGRRETLRHTEPDAAIAAGDDRDAAGKIEQVHWISPIRSAKPTAPHRSQGCAWASATGRGEIAPTLASTPRRGQANRPLNMVASKARCANA